MRCFAVLFSVLFALLLCGTYADDESNDTVADTSKSPSTTTESTTKKVDIVKTTTTIHPGKHTESAHTNPDNSDSGSSDNNVTSSYNGASKSSLSLFGALSISLLVSALACKIL